MKETLAEQKILLEAPRKSSRHPRAWASLLLGDRKVCDFLAAADLGVGGAGEWRTIEIDYAPGTDVTPERVIKALEDMKARSDEEKAPFKILAYEFLGVTEVET